jgi:hypothetical protein
MQVQIQAPNPALLFPILVHILHYQQGVVECLSLRCTQQKNKKRSCTSKSLQKVPNLFFPKTCTSAKPQIKIFFFGWVLLQIMQDGAPVESSI